MTDNTSDSSKGNLHERTFWHEGEPIGRIWVDADGLHYEGGTDEATQTLLAEVLRHMQPFVPQLATCVELVIQAGLSTGHADDHIDLMREVLAQVGYLRRELIQTQTSEAQAVQSCRLLNQKLAELRGGEHD